MADMPLKEAFNTSTQEIKERLQASDLATNNLGIELVNVLFSTIKIAAMYEANNNRYIDQAIKLREILTKLFHIDPDFSLVTKGGHFFVLDVRLKNEHDISAAKAYFVDRWASFGISGFSFNKKLDPDELDKFIYFIGGFKPGVDILDNQQALKDGLDQLQIESIAPVRLSDSDAGEGADGDTSEAGDVKNSTHSGARKAFFGAVTAVQEALGQARISNHVNIAKTKRVVQQLIDQIMSNECALIEMTALRNFDDYTYVHSVNVCVLSLVLGYHIGLDRKRLSNLGVGALLHDLGKTKLTKELVNKPGRFDDYDWTLMRKHPIYGVKVLFKTRAIDETTSRAAATIFEHHLSFDSTGYPELLNKRKPALFARIVAIADTYNAMTSGRVYHNKRHLPDETITSMVNRVGKVFDPLLLKTFINIMGIFPVGTVVALSSKEIGIIAKNNPDNLEKPQVKVIADETGLYDLSEVKVLDLSKEPGISVTKIIDDDKYNIDIANYLEIG
jgi:HD-GYP domain-containing protein (c-di-GMP phosphodiesterase class II)